MDVWQEGRVSAGWNLPDVMLFELCVNVTFDGSFFPLQCRLPTVVMATPVYVEELQQPTQQPGGALGVAPGQPPAPPTTTPPAPPPFLAELQTAVTPPPVTATAPPQTGQATPPAAQATSQKQAAPAQYVTAEIQGSGTASSNGQSTPQYIVVTVTGEGAA